MGGFADDIAWQCCELGLDKPVIIGHSLGGAITLELCGRHPDLAAGMVMIDSIVMASPSLRESPKLHFLLEGIGGPDYLAVSKANAWDIGCDFDDPARRKAIYDKYILPPCASTRQHVAFSAIHSFATEYDPIPAAQACKIPMAYISADVPLVNMARDLDRLQALCPQVVIAKTLATLRATSQPPADRLDRRSRVGAYRTGTTALTNPLISLTRVQARFGRSS